MNREEQITKAALDYANNLEDVPIKDQFSKMLAIALGQAFMKGAEWADKNPNGTVKEACIMPAMLSNFGNSIYNIQVELSPDEKGALDVISFIKPKIKVMLI